MSSSVPDKGKNFSEWFDWILSEAEIYDYGRYPVKGMGVWLPYGFQIRRYTIELLRKLLDETGHEEILLPLLIPEPLLKKESEHIAGFEGQVFWVTKGGLEDLDVRLALRPTSETALSFMESLWIKSYKQLPKKYYQVVSVFRYETKMTKAMLRVREITSFKEAHTAHETFEDSERQILEAVDIYRKFFDELGIPYLISRRPQWDKFAGAIYTIAFDTLFPDGKAVQIGTVHNLGQTFSSVFEVRIQKRDGSLDYVWQTSYGVSERVIASLIAIHGDDRGLVLPPNVAPVQVVIIPIPSEQTLIGDIIRYCKEIEEELKKEGFRAKLDDREELRPVDKYFYWELRGVPLRIEIGPKELREGVVTVFRRDLMKRITVLRRGISNTIREYLHDIHRNLREKSWKNFNSKLKVVETVEEAVEVVKTGGIASVPWCGNERCAYEYAKKLQGIEMLGEPFTLTDAESSVNVANMKCAFCGRQAATFMRIANKY